MPRRMGTGRQGELCLAINWKGGISRLIKHEIQSWQVGFWVLSLRVASLRSSAATVPARAEPGEDMSPAVTSTFTPQLFIWSVAQSLK